MRTLASWEQLLATTDDDGVQVQQYADATIRAGVAGGEVRLEARTAWPWDGRVVVEIVEAPPEPWTLTLRRPAWATEATIAWPGADAASLPAAEMAPSRHATWRAGDRVVLDVSMAPRLTDPHPRVDAVRDTLAIERGPLVYCLETADLPNDVVLEDVRIAPDAGLVVEDRADLGSDVVGVTAAGSGGPRAGVRSGRDAGQVAGHPLPPLGEPGTGRDARLDPTRPRGRGRERLAPIGRWRRRRFADDQ
jgi:DUF1680 family protein